MGASFLGRFPALAEENCHCGFLASMIIDKHRRCSTGVPWLDQVTAGGLCFSAVAPWPQPGDNHSLASDLLFHLESTNPSIPLGSTHPRYIPWLKALKPMHATVYGEVLPCAGEDKSTSESDGRCSSRLMKASTLPARIGCYVGNPR